MKKGLLILMLAMGWGQMWALDAPTLTSPSTNYQNAFTRIVLSGTKGKNDSYQLQVDTTRLFNSRLLKKETASILNTSFSSTITDLHFNTHYYWRVRSISAADTSAWSEVRDFYTNHPVTIVGPNDTSKTATYPPEQNLRWKTHPGCGTYTLETDTVPTFTSPVKVRQTWSSIVPTKEETTSQSVQDLHLGKMIYWRVKYYNENDSSDWSETGRFHTLNKAKGKNPDGYTSTYTVQEFEWEYKKGLNNVIIEIDTTETFSSPAKRVEKSSGSSQGYCFTNISNLYFGTMHYWRVKAYHQKDTTEWSDVLSFKTYRAGSLKTTPADRAVEQSTSPLLYFTYHKGVSQYQMQLDTTPEFNSPALENRIKKASSQDYAYGTYTDLLFGTKYYRRVRDCHEKDTSLWSETWSFTTIYQLAKPILTEPANQTTHYNDELITFVWNTCEDASTYIYQLSDDGQFNTFLHQEILTDTTTSLVPPSNSILYWRVQAINSKGRSPWSDVRGIGTIAPQPTSINDNQNDNHNHNDNDNQARKVMENGHLYIIKDDKRYDTTGFTRD